ncbi:MAG: bifunctional helix-turn-helix domain-containing protein/methylated-DNA--[protein]-cysteine S-methyltransferase [Anaerolineales bacterium]|nr:bifunctional helix-turn-helix domain-containing protein/methylated-DNA--[protein]-cysteine S-methyltransferase [Anaerolineales bacterium]
MNPIDQNSPADYQQLSNDYRLVEKALVYLENHYLEQPSLEDVAASAGLSEYHFQRLFAHWVGISPKRFLQFLTKEHAKAMLEGSANLLDVAYQSGLSGPGRLHDLFVTCEAVTPGEYKSRGEGLTIAYGFHPSPFGECLLAATERGICGLSFVSEGDRQPALAKLKMRWRKAELVEDMVQTAALISLVFPVLRDLPGVPLRILLNGTNFQIKVWEALLHIPPGKVVAYEDIAVHLGMPRAARAVSRAVADNPIAVIIPCHRVIRKMGLLGGYRWGLARKRALLGWEMARVNA